MALGNLAGDAEQRKTVAARSYAHPNGFDRISLHREPQGLEVRVHLWWTGVVSDETIHNHAWDFSSLVLSGSLRFQLLHRAREGETYDCYESTMPPGGVLGDYGFARTGRVSLGVSLDAEVTAGSFYRMHRDTYHRVLAAPGRDPMTATMVVRGPVRRSFSHVLVPSGTRMPPSRSMRHLAEGEIMDKLGSLLDVLTGA
ncbi:hypothetical protein [Nonomuraea sp. KM88]|uniref:hypothetical protein n=1 Tax=Nonomuraea sp. KM88 TaxID=3457427 RepID=UPI003FCCAFA7